MTAPRIVAAADRERRRRRDRVKDLCSALIDGGHGLVLRDHGVEWTTHPVPYCAGACPGGETWPCPPVREVARRAGIGVAL